VALHADLRQSHSFENFRIHSCHQISIENITCHMKKTVLNLLDRAVPHHARIGSQVEDVARARMLVFLQYLLMFSSATAWMVSFIYLQFSTVSKYGNIPAILLGAFFGYSSSIIIFRRGNLRIVSSNVLALTQYVTHVLILIILPDDIQIAWLLYLLALPFLITVIADYRSGIFWLTMVSIAPVFLSLFGTNNYEYYYLANWIASSAGLFMAIYGSQIYISNFSKRLQIERNGFEFDASHDSLTGLINRATFEKRLEHCVEACFSSGRKFVLVYLDLDKFKPINDSHGHQAGDEVLRVVAKRLKHLVRSSDLAARLGGDEFAIIFDDTTLELVEPVISRIESVIRMPINIAGCSLSVGCSVGVATCPEDGCDSRSLAQRADEQMYASKTGSSSAH
jgi:diguanylate cyclase (GGDEF)-like protein